MTILHPSHRRQNSPSELIIRNSCDEVIHCPPSSFSGPTTAAGTGNNNLEDNNDSMAKTYGQLADEAISKYKEMGRGEGRRLWIGLAGAPGSGKSTVGDAVVERICEKGISAKAVSMDRWHHRQSDLARMDMDINRKGAPWTFDANRMFQDLHQAKTGGCHSTVSFPSYSRELSEPVDNQVDLDESHQIIIVEGLYVLLGFLAEEAQHRLGTGPLYNEIKELGCPHDVRDEIARWKPVTDLWDLTWFGEPPAGFDENKKRLIKRSLQTWTAEKTQRFGGGTDEEAATRRVESNDAKNGKLVSCCKRYATVQIDSV